MPIGYARPLRVDPARTARPVGRSTVELVARCCDVSPLVATILRVAMTIIPPPDPALRFAALVESSDDAIVSKSVHGIITSWNHGAERLFGYTAAEAVGHSIKMLIPPDRLHEEDMVLERIGRGERMPPFDTVRRRKDGT